MRPVRDRHSERPVLKRQDIDLRLLQLRVENRRINIGEGIQLALHKVLRAPRIEVRLRAGLQLSRAGDGDPERAEQCQCHRTHQAEHEERAEQNGTVLVISGRRITHRGP